MGRRKGYWTVLREILFLPLAYLLPKSKHLAVFGAWGGKMVSDNPKYLMLYLVEHTSCRCVWIGSPQVRPLVEAMGPRVQFARRGSFAAAWLCLRARLIAYNINFNDDVDAVPIRGKTILLNLWHGIPFKRIGCDQFGNTIGGGAIARGRFRQAIARFLVRLTKQPAWTSVSSGAVGRQLAHGFPEWFSEARLLSAGMPRNDFLVNNAENNQLKRNLKAKYAKLFGLPMDKRWYLYLPTYRHSGKIYSFATSPSAAAFAKVLDVQGAVLIEKQHPRVLAQLGIHERTNKGGVVVLTEQDGSQMDVQELLLCADRLITDYSSCYFDFSLMNRPVIHFAYDYDDYVSCDTGVYYQLSDVAAGIICDTESKTLEALAMDDTALLRHKGQDFPKLVAFEQGHASETIFSRFLKA